jgi:hypothetical protein
VVLLQLLRERIVVLFRLIGQHIMGLDVDREPAFRCAIGYPLGLQRIGRARPLKNHQPRKLALTLRLCNLAMDMPVVNVIHFQDEVLDIQL